MRNLLLALTSLLLLLGSCARDQSAVDPGNEPFLVGKPEQGKVVKSLYVDPSPDWTWELISEDGDVYGTVAVSNDSDTLSVVYDPADSYLVSKAELYVGTEAPPHGNPGQFPYKEHFNPAVEGWTFEVPLDELPGKSLLYIAAHADIEKGSTKESCWAGNWNDGNPSWDFGWDKKWGGGFNTRVMPLPELPSGTVEYRAFHRGKFSYWGVQFTDNLSLPPGEYSVGGNTRYVGWCMDHNHYMYANAPYDVTLYSTYDQDIPAFGQNDNWDMVNWMLTQRRNNGGGIWDQDWESNAVKDQFQAACWYFSNGVEPAAGSLAESFVAEAIANGDDFIPGPGEFYGLVLYPDTSTNNRWVRAQMNIIEVDP